MANVHIKFPDGSVKDFASGTTGFDVAKSISPRLAKEAIAVKSNGSILDLNRPVPDGSPIRILTFNDTEGKEVFWHSSSHIMAQAVQELFPKVKLAIGPPIDNGWYYDFEIDRPFTPEDLERIENKMKEIVKEDAPFRCEEKKTDEAKKYFASKDAIYKVDILERIPDDTVTFYYQSRFEDLCRGPHIPSTGIIKAFKLTSTSGAYWRGDEKNKMLQRIYGISFPKQSMLDEYVQLQEEAKKRDHRILGKQLELFHISEEVGAGLILWMPKGGLIRHEIENFWRAEHLNSGYQLLYTPHIAHLGLWQKSGHTDFYTESMFGPIEVDEQKYQLKPMNCPFHIVMYRSRLWSYRDLPLRWAELGTVYRYERPGVIHGLLRVRGFTQDDAHHFVAHDKMEEELVWTLKFCIHILDSFGFKDYDIFLSTRPEKAIGDPSDWVRAENGLRMALESLKLNYQVDEGGGAFYGPKIDIKIKDALKRAWQCSTIQFDFSLPERFDLSYIDTDGKQKRPYMIHRALLGSIERFFGVLIEHYAGNFPLWLSPVQVKVLPITDSMNDYARQVQMELYTAKIRAEIDDRSEKIGAKIRDAELMKVPYMFIIGGKEAENKTVSVRKHGKGDLGAQPIDKVIESLKAEVETKGLK